MVSELLDMLRKTEQSLARVRRNRPADAVTAADGSELSNIQKISLQLFLDVQVCSQCNCLQLVFDSRFQNPYDSTQTTPNESLNTSAAMLHIKQLLQCAACCACTLLLHKMQLVITLHTVNWFASL